MAEKFARELGFAAGISSGENFLGALLVQDDIDGDACVVTVFPDDNKKYLSAALLPEEPVGDDFHYSDMRLHTLEAYKRV